MMETTPDTSPSRNEKLRFNIGVGIVCLVIFSWLLIPLSSALDVPTSKIALLTGALFIANKVLLLLAITIMGKAGFQHLKQLIWGHFKKVLPTSTGTVGPTRHWIGVIMFCLPLISSILEPYVDHFWPGLRPNIWQLQLLSDAMLIASFFVLGGNFWDKAMALFSRTAKVTTTDTP